MTYNSELEMSFLEKKRIRANIIAVGKHFAVLGSRGQNPWVEFIGITIPTQCKNFLILKATT